MDKLVCVCAVVRVVHSAALLVLTLLVLFLPLLLCVPPPGLSSENKIYQVPGTKYSPGVVLTVSELTIDYVMVVAFALPPYFSISANPGGLRF